MNRFLCGFFGFILMFAFLIIGFAGTAQAEVNVSINIGPPVFVSEPAEVVYVPQMGFYFVPGGSYDVFFYNGYWWSRRSDRWFRASQYRGPWGVASSVPANLRGLRPDYRDVYGRTGSRINYGQWKKNNWRPINAGRQQLNNQNRQLNNQNRQLNNQNRQLNNQNRQLNNQNRQPQKQGGNKQGRGGKH